jgi:hypothetical protein
MCVFVQFNVLVEFLFCNEEKEKPTSSVMGGFQFRLEISELRKRKMRFQSNNEKSCLLFPSYFIFILLFIPIKSLGMVLH